jgi:glutamate-ammonia-ligase adenylyltransferase
VSQIILDKLSHMAKPKNYDQICPRLPLIDLASKPIRDEFAKTLQGNWSDQNRHDIGYNADDLATMLAFSPYLQRLALRHDNDITRNLKGNNSQQIELARVAFIDEIEDANCDAAAMRAIRTWRERSALAIALADITGLHDMPKQMRWLSEAAQTVLTHTVSYLFRCAIKQGNIKFSAKDFTGCGWTVLALGKLGAGELNFSSDVDLIALHDTNNAPFDSPDAVQPFFVTMTRDLIRLLSTTTRDGIGWRVDLRLRPDPGATAVSIDFNAAIGYYESIARTWERAAFIRARPIAGDLQLGKVFLDQIQPFIWRRTLDYTVMEDMKTMLRRPPQTKSWLGYNLKTGKNGIRQIEFFIHVLQLVTGGRDTKLRDSNSLSALNALAAAGWITHEQSDGLADAYQQLRRIEHRLQMVGDNQTHSLPRSTEDLEKFAHFMGHNSANGFCHELARLLGRVGQHAAHDLLDPKVQNEDGDDDIKNVLIEDYDALFTWLTDNGFQRPKIVADTLSGWMAGRISATRSERARMLLNRLMPDILISLTAADAPDDKFAALAQFVEGLPASVQIFSLLDYNRDLTRLLCDILLLSPQLGNHLRHHPTLFDLLLYQAFFEPLPNTTTMVNQLRDNCANLPVEDALDRLKIKVREWKFSIEVQALGQIIDSADLAKGLSAIATATVVLIMDFAKADMVRRHGQIDGKVNILGLGRLGTKQMTVSSDLDLLIIYEASESALSKSKRPISAPVYFARLAQTMISWLSTATAEGVLYSVDLRLRPEGKAGSIATSLDRFETYFEHDAWVWEKMALTKARFIAGDACLAKKLNAAIHKIVNQPHDQEVVGKAVGSMLNRIRKSQNEQSKWHLRTRDGGLVDLDLLIQAMRLEHGNLFDDTGQSPLDILDRLVAVRKISSPDFTELQDAISLFNEIHHCIRLTFGEATHVPDSLPARLRTFILSRIDIADEAQLALLLKTSLDQVHKQLLTYSRIEK